MEIHVLKVRITELEINDLANRGIQAGGASVRDLEVRLTPAGIHVKGTYQTMVRMPFETLWEVAVQNGKIVAKLAELKFVGFGAQMFRSVLMRSICDAVQGEDAIEVQGDSLHLDLDRFLALRGFTSRTNLTAVRCELGSFHIEAGNSGQ